MDGVMRGIGYAADAEVGRGARFDDRAQAREAVQDELLPVADFREALGRVGACDDVVGCALFEGLAFGPKRGGVHLKTISRERGGVVEVVRDLVEAFANPFFDVCIGAAGNGDFRIQAEGDGMAQAARAHFSGFMAPANRAFKGFVKIAFADVIGDFKGAMGALQVVFAYPFEKCAVAFGGIAFFHMGEVDADNGGDEFGIFVQEVLHPFVVLHRGPAVQADDVARGGVALRGACEDLGIDAVKVDECFARFITATTAVFDKGDALFFVPVNCAPKGVFQEFPSFWWMSQEADDEVEFGLEPPKVAPVFLRVDVVFPKFVQSRARVRQGIAKERDGIRARAISAFISICKNPPVHFFVKILAEREDIFRGQASSGVNVQFACFGEIEARHDSVPLFVA